MEITREQQFHLQHKLNLLHQRTRTFEFIVLYSHSLETSEALLMLMTKLTSTRDSIIRNIQLSPSNSHCFHVSAVIVVVVSSMPELKAMLKLISKVIVLIHNVTGCSGM